MGQVSLSLLHLPRVWCAATQTGQRWSLTTVSNPTCPQTPADGFSFCKCTSSIQQDTKDWIHWRRRSLHNLKTGSQHLRLPGNNAFLPQGLLKRLMLPRGGKALRKLPLIMVADPTDRFRVILRYTNQELRTYFKWSTSTVVHVFLNRN